MQLIECSVRGEIVGLNVHSPADVKLWGAVHDADCPDCHQRRGVVCVMERSWEGSILYYVHKARMIAAGLLPPEELPAPTKPFLTVAL